MRSGSGCVASGSGGVSRRNADDHVAGGAGRLTSGVKCGEEPHAHRSLRRRQEARLGQHTTRSATSCCTRSAWAAAPTICSSPTSASSRCCRRSRWFRRFPAMLNLGGAMQVNPAMVLHGEQAIEVPGPIPTEGTVVTTPTIKAVYDKGKGAVVVVGDRVGRREGQGALPLAVVDLRARRGRLRRRSRPERREERPARSRARQVDLVRARCRSRRSSTGSPAT